MRSDQLSLVRGSSKQKVASMGANHFAGELKWPWLHYFLKAVCSFWLSFDVLEWNQVFGTVCNEGNLHTWWTVRWTHFIVHVFAKCIFQREDSILNIDIVLLFDHFPSRDEDRIRVHFLCLWTNTLLNLVNWWQRTANCRRLGLTGLNCLQIYLFFAKAGQNMFEE